MVETAHEFYKRVAAGKYVLVQYQYGCERDGPPIPRAVADSFEELVAYARENDLALATEDSYPPYGIVTPEERMDANHSGNSRA